MWEKPKTFDEAKKLIAGHAGVEFEKYPLKFAVPAYFGIRPQQGEPATVKSGTASLVRIGGQPYALTCSHVLEAYRENLAEGACIFQIGNCELDPLTQLKVEDKKLDYAFIGLTEAQGKEITTPDGPFDGKFFYEVAQWPPGDVMNGEFVAFGGFPGKLRQAMSFDELSFGSFSSGASRVASVGEDYVVSQFEREFWVKHGQEAEPETIRGMSGGPVFAIRHNAASGIITYEFIGHIYEFSEDFELLYVRLVRTLTL